MNMGLFKKVVKNKILEVFEDITDSASDLNKIGYKKLMKNQKWTLSQSFQANTLIDIH